MSQNSNIIIIYSTDIYNSELFFNFIDEVLNKETEKRFETYFDLYYINETNRVENCDKDDEEMEGDK